MSDLALMLDDRVSAVRLPRSCCWSLPCSGDELDLDRCAKGWSGYDGGAGRVPLVEDRGVDAVGGGEVREVGQLDVDLDDVRRSARNGALAGQKEQRALSGGERVGAGSGRCRHGMTGVSSQPRATVTPRRPPLWGN